MTPKSVIVVSPAYMTAVAGLMTSVPMATWRDYLRWKVTDAASPYISSRFVNERFAFRSILTGTKSLPPRWKRCMTATDESLGEALGAAYVAKEFPPEAKARALAMVGNLEAALRDRISTLDWMSDATRKEALAKLAAFRVKIGYPDRFRDYSSLRIPAGASYYQSAMLANEFEFRRQMAKADKPTDLNEWGMTPQTVDAYNNALNNEIVFPAAILQPPFFDANADDASNYGAMGAIIGHEITHGYDDQGRQFDASGTLRDWWTKEDAAKYDEAAGRIRDQYSAYIVADTFHVNGKLTLGENIADFGGLKIAYAAFEKAMTGKSRAPVDGFTPEQRFFIAYANAWRTKIRPEAMILQSRTDPHSPGEWRVIGAISNLPEFAQAFGCKAGDKMVRGRRCGRRFGSAAAGLRYPSSSRRATRSRPISASAYGSISPSRCSTANPPRPIATCISVRCCATIATCVIRPSARSEKNNKSPALHASGTSSSATPSSACCRASLGIAAPCSSNTVCTIPEQSAPHGVTPPH